MQHKGEKMHKLDFAHIDVPHHKTSVLASLPLGHNVSLGFSGWYIDDYISETKCNLTNQNLTYRNIKCVREEKVLGMQLIPSTSLMVLVHVEMVLDARGHHLPKENWISKIFSEKDITRYKYQHWSYHDLIQFPSESNSCPSPFSVLWRNSDDYGEFALLQLTSTCLSL